MCFFLIYTDGRVLTSNEHVVSQLFASEVHSCNAPLVSRRRLKRRQFTIGIPKRSICNARVCVCVCACVCMRVSVSVSVSVSVIVSVSASVSVSVNVSASVSVS